MKILLIEDDLDKQKAIEEVIKANISLCQIQNASNLADARRDLLVKVFDLVIFDMYLPDTQSSEHERDCSEELITEFSKSRNYRSEAIALTQFEINELDDIQLFNTAGITVVLYDSSKNWISALRHKIERVTQSIKYDFLIFCALPNERNGFKETECEIGETKKISGIDCLEAKLGNTQGLIIKPQRMGLVNMAIVASKAIELFQPKIVAMSGICAGINGEANYLDILVGSTCWEYQTGKWKDGIFQQEPYQVTVDSGLRIDLEQTTENPSLIDYVKDGLNVTELQNFKIKVAPICSGSAVIADDERMQQIPDQHRKVVGLEMEMYALYETAHQSLSKPLYFGAKAVVDMGGKSKGDEYHNTACIISARYVTFVLKEKFKELDSIPK